MLPLRAKRRFMTFGPNMIRLFTYNLNIGLKILNDRPHFLFNFFVLVVFNIISHLGGKESNNAVRYSVKFASGVLDLCSAVCTVKVFKYKCSFHNMISFELIYFCFIRLHICDRVRWLLSIRHDHRRGNSTWTCRLF